MCSNGTKLIICVAALLLITVGACATAPNAQWRSSLYPEEWVPAYTDHEGRFLHDFSYAGYHAGEKPLPTTIPGERIDVTQPPYNADNTGKESATEAIQKALNAVGLAGGGTVYLPEGTYRITYTYSGLSAALIMTYSNVVLQGAGVGKTFLYLDETVSRSKSMIAVGSAINAMSLNTPKDGVTQAIRSDVAARSSVIPLDGPPIFAVGDWVVVQYTLTQEWVAEHNMSDGWDSSISGPGFYRKIVAVDNEQNTITLDAPVRYAVLVRDNGRVYCVNDPLTEVGMADFSIGMKEHPATTGWGSADHGTFGTGAYDVHASRAVSFRGVVNGWARDIATYQPAGNQYAHIHSIGFSVSHSRFLTFSRLSVENPQYLGGGGNGYPYVIGSQDSLYDNLRAINGRHNFTISGMQASGNVIYRGYISNPRHSLAADFHAYLSMANLIDNLTIDQDRFDAGDRSGAAGVAGFPKHGVTTTASVFWNNAGLAYRKDLPGIISSNQYGWGYVIGTRGPAPNVDIRSNYRTEPADFVEGVGTGALLQPQSLYVDQLQRRLAREGKAEVWEIMREQLTPPAISQADIALAVQANSPQESASFISKVTGLPLLLHEDFETAEIGSLPTGWEALASKNSSDFPAVAKAAVTGSSGEQYLELTRTAGSSNVTGHALFNFAPVKERLVISFRLYATTARRSLRLVFGGTEYPTPHDVHGTVGNAGVFIAMNGGNINFLRDLAANKWDLGATYNAGVWHQVTLDFDIAAQTVNVYMDDAATPSNTVPIAFFSPAMKDINTVGFCYQSISSHNNTAPVYVDDVVIMAK